MKGSSTPLAPWLKWTLRSLGVLMLLAVLARLPYVAIPTWRLVSSLKSGAASASTRSQGLVLAGLAGQYVAMVVWAYGALWLLRRSSGRRAAPAVADSSTAAPAAKTPETAPAPAPSSDPSPVRRPVSRRWSLCNVLLSGPYSRRIWQFDAHSKGFNLNREQTVPSDESLPFHVVGKSWSSLWQTKLNVGWLPPDDVFIRVAQFPASSPEETFAMVELQLEKLSPVPVTQAVWTLHVMPPTARGSGLAATEAGRMQTVIVTIVARSAVEEFLGKLEGQGYLADRLELPLLDQLQATAIQEDGAWIYPAGAGRNVAFVAWWYGGVLQNLDLLQLSAETDRAAGTRDQLMQMAWAGELEGWLTSPPAWHLVADEDAAREWEPLLRQGLEQPVVVAAPLPPTELAALTARRATQADPRISLLPAEFATRYRQRFVDRLWLRGLLAALALYGIGCVIYFIAVLFLGIQVRAVEKETASRGPTYTNVMQLKALVGVLRERQDLKYAALDCWRATAELMPEGLTLDSLNFSDGSRLSLNGSVPAQQIISASDFSGKLRKARLRDQPLFNDIGEAFSSRVNPGMATATWSFSLGLNRAEEP